MQYPLGLLAQSAQGYLRVQDHLRAQENLATQDYQLDHLDHLDLADLLGP